MINRYIFWLSLLLPAGALAQQEAMYTQFMFNKLAYNPGYAGTFESPTLTLNYRKQWIGLDGAPSTQLISYDQPVLSNRVGIGGNLARTTIGISKITTFDVAYAYRIAFRRGYLGVGLQASIRHFYQDWSDDRLRADRPIPTDVAIPLLPESKLLPNFGAGVYYNARRWYAGIALPRIVRNNIDFSDAGQELSRESQHFNAMGGIKFYLTDDAVLTPQALIKYAVKAPLDAEVNVSLMLYKKFHSGLTYRMGGDTNYAGESVDVLLGLQATDKLFFCVTYDIGLTRLRKFHNGTLELVARWWFNPPEGDDDGPRPSNPNL
jgi:type IX secretion system PorP/SprF family membrane protein